MESTGSASPAVRDVARRITRAAFRAFRGRGVRSTVGAQVVILFLGAGTGVMSARLLGPQGRGELAATTLWPAVLLLLGAVGMSQSIVFHTGRQLFPVSEIWGTALSLAAAQSVFVILAGWVVLPVVLKSYSRSVESCAFAMLLTAPFMLVAACEGALLQGRLRFVTFNMTRLLTPLVYALGLGILMLWRKPSLPHVMGAQILGLVVGASVAYLLLRREVAPGLAWSRRACASLLKYGFKTQFESVNTYINQRADQLLLSLFVPPRQLGLYVVAVTASSVVAFFPQAMGIVTLATGSNLPPDDAKQAIVQSFRLSFLWLSAACGAIFILAPWLIPFFFGGRFSESVLACRILLPGTLFLGLRQVLYEGARALGKPAVPSYSEGVGTLVTIVGLYLLLPRYGFVGAAIASTLAYGTSLLFILLIFNHGLGVAWRTLLVTGALPWRTPRSDASF